MKSRQSGLASGGFTIIETLIVLAVTGALFISVVGIINGRQNKTEFTLGLNDLTTQLQQVAREVSTGFYPGLVDKTCRSNGGSLAIAVGSSQQGSNGGCVFIGKVVQFNPVDLDQGNEVYAAYTLAGCQFKNCSTNVSAPTTNSFSEAKPLILHKTASGIASNFPDDITSWYTMKNGLSVMDIGYECEMTEPTCPSSGTNSTRAIGFLQSFGSYGSCGGGLCSGAQQAGLYAINTSGLTGSPDSITMGTFLNAIDVNAASLIVPVKTIRLCLESGTTNQVALMSIGPTPSSISSEIISGEVCHV